MTDFSPHEYLAELKQQLPSMTAAEVRQQLKLELLRLGLGATFDTRPVTAVKARLTELGEELP